MKKFIIYLFFVFLIFGCKKEDAFVNIPDNLLFVKKIVWTSMSIDFFAEASYTEGKLLELKRGVGDRWFDSLYCSYTGTILDSATYFNRLKWDDPLVLRLYFSYTNNKITQIIKYDLAKQMATDTVHLFYSNDKLIKINSQNKDINVDSEGTGKYYNPYYLISKRIGFPYFKIMFYEAESHFYGDDRSERVDLSDLECITDSYGRLIKAYTPQNTDNKIKIEYY